MSLDDLQGRLLAGLLARRRADADAGRDRQTLAPGVSRSYARWWRRRPSAAPPSSWVASTCRCTASRSLRRTSTFSAPPVSSCARCAAWWCRWPALATRLAARRRRSRAGDRSAQDAAQVDVHRRRADRRRAEKVASRAAGAGGACDVSGSVAVQPLHAAAGARCASGSPGCACSPSSTPPTKSPGYSGPTPTWPWPCSASPAKRRLHPRRAPIWQRVRLIHGEWPNVLSPRSSLLVLGDSQNNTATRKPTCWPTWSTRAGTRTGSIRAQAPGAARRGGAALPGRHHMHECRSTKQLAR